MSIPGSGSPLLLATTAAAADAAYVIPKSLRFNDDDQAYLAKTVTSVGDQRKMTFSFWIKRHSVSSSSAFAIFAQDYLTSPSNAVVDRSLSMLFDGDRLELYDYGASSGHGDSGSVQAWTAGVVQEGSDNVLFRDPSAWYSVIFAIDTTQSTEANRCKVWINGVQRTMSGYPVQNSYLSWGQAKNHYIGIQKTNGSFTRAGDFSLADVQFIDGQQLSNTDFGEFDSNGVWRPKEASFTNPNNGTTWSSDLTATSSGAYFASGAGAADAFDGDLDNSAQSEPNGSTITFSPTGGIAVSTSLRVYRGSDSTSNTVNVSVNGGSSVTFTKSAWVDLSFTGTLTSLAVSSPSANPGLSAVEVDGVILIDGAGTYGKNGFHLNFSDSSTIEALGFDSAPTTPDPDPKKGFDVITYSGTGATQNIGGLNFEPGLVWFKPRETGNHKLIDSVRGKNKRLESDTTDAEETNNDSILSFNPDGFTLGTAGTVNNSTNTFVAWTWRAGGPAVAKTSGTINAEVSVSTDYGFSICKFTGTGTAGTIEHGLSTVPKWYIVKNLDTSPSEWNVFHVSTGETKRLKLNSNSAAQTAANSWNDTAPTASLFTVGTDTDVNKSGDEHIAYVWSEVSGFSKFGSYTGNGSTTGPTITTGFKPKFILIKRTDSAENWFISDTERSPSNTADDGLFPSLSNAESTGNSDLAIDFLDDGFQLKSGTATISNASGGTYIYAAFADRPGNNWDVNNIVTNEGLTTSKTQFDVVTYTGNGGTQSIDSLAFQPDLVWLKSRSASQGNILFDSVRGVSNAVFSNNTLAETGQYQKLSSFDSNGFTLTSGTDGSSPNEGNTSSNTYVAWCWKAGGTAVSNTDGTITSSVSANAAYGFSIVSYTGTGANATVGHGLGKSPDLIIIKNRDTALNDAWRVWASALAANERLVLNETKAVGSGSTLWQNTLPTSSVFYLDNESRYNTSGDDHIAYCFANVPGYQRIGSYTGNGSSTGPVIPTGFRPRFLIIKKTSGTGPWYMYDSERDNSGNIDKLLQVESSAAEFTTGANYVDFQDSGFQLKGTGGDTNASGSTYVYLAIGDDEIGSDEDCLVDVPNAVTADADATDTTGGYQRGNYATLNPLHNYNSPTYANGNLEVSNTSTGHWKSAQATIGVTSGKWYWESTMSGASQYYTLGVAIASEVTNNYTGSGDAFVYDGRGFKNGPGVSSVSYGATYTSGDTIGVALDLDAGTLVFYKNGVSQGTAFSTGLTDKTLFPQFSVYYTSAVTQIVNFGQMRFKYPMPTGFSSLNTTALPAATIPDGSAQFDTVLWSGNETQARAITGLNYSPDLVWLKRRNAGSTSHQLHDAVRGASAGTLYADLTNAEDSNYNLTSFDSSGFTLGTVPDLTSVNKSGGTYVAWAWDAGSSTVSNTDGSITSSVRANATAGFSIVAYSGNSTSGATIGHGLNAAPEFVVVKARNIGTQGWCVYHASLGATKYIQMDTTNAASTYSGTWNNTSPTNSVFTVGNDNIVNTGYNYVAYCFTPVAGYSAFGSYEGNSNADGPFIYTGFRPRWIMYKWADGGGEWAIRDTARSTYNVSDQVLTADSSGAEQENAVWNVDILSNGFKIRTSSAGSNSSSTFIYAVFAENPFQANGGLAR